MDDKTLAKWMQEQAAKVRGLSDQIREHIVTVPPTGREAWIDELRKRFDLLADCLRGMMDIEQEGGYLQPVIEHRPSLAGQVELLRHEHEELIVLMEELRRTIHSLRPQDNLLIRDTCTRIHVFLGHVQRHEEHENHIVLYTLTQDIGVKD